MSSRPGREKSHPSRGKAVASGPATIRLSSPALSMLQVMHRSDRVIFLLHLHGAPFTQTLFELPPITPKWKAIGLYLLTVSGSFSCVWNKMKKRGSQGERLCCLRSWQSACTGSFTHFLLEMIFWHLFSDPLKTRLNLENPFSQSCECNGKRKAAHDWRLKLNEKEEILLELFSLFL